MINRAKMPRQLRNKGGITNVTPRTNYFLGGIKKRIRKLIPNELADIAVKAAPFVAPFNPAIAGLMRGIGRFDQRGSISDALKQGFGTYVGGQGLRMLGGAGAQEGLGGFRFSSPLDESRTAAVRNLFDPQKKSTFDAIAEDELAGDKILTGKTRGIGAIEKLRQQIPIINKLDPIVGQQLIVGGATSAASLIYDSFVNNYREHDPETESYDEYLARRKEVVGRQMRQYFDNYFKFDKEYSALDDAGKDAFVARYNLKKGGRAGYQAGGITMANTLAENIRRNLANQAAVAQQFRQARRNIPGFVEPQRISAPKAAPIKIEEPDLPISKPIQPPGGDVQPLLPVMPDQPGLFPQPPKKIIPEDPPPLMDDLVRLPVAPPLTDEEILEERELNPPTPPFFPTLPVEPMTDQQILEGFAEFKRQNPDLMNRPATQAIVNLTLPGGTPISFRSGAGAAALNQYLESIGMRAGPGKEEAVRFAGDGLEKLNDPMMIGFDYSKEINWSPGQPAPEGYRVVKMMGDEFLERKFPSKEEVAGLPMPFLKGGRVNFSEGANIKKKLKKIGYEDTLLDKMSLKELIDLLNSEEGTFTDSSIYRPGAAKGGMPTGIMKTNKAGVMERDYRDKGGFVPVGIKEKADDVPAMLSKNEFVMTADAVRGAGNGSIDKGAQRMYDTMKRLEKRVV